ncbi:polysaccharide biosynthesis tyrosine autokinase [Pedobacter sp. MC2016-15]|uniref:GumC family protein n=1 Tax=Pedobacter sp. MC2016-15 TaxID=2994473 RepID=UPI0022458436|nr:tyrosine-protein kinase [Pedobacter sp. MC2016-15]MCX2481162.1 polysaccharide biosynthesis tyrosine autokinase [Pedobacter sp. MC2016-15]
MPPQEDVFVEKNKINFKQLATKMLRNWYWLVLSLVLCLALSFIYLRYATPQYFTTSRILLKNDEKASLGDNEIAKALGGQLGSSSSTEGEAEILKTTHLMSKVVKDLKAYVTYFNKGQIKSVNLYKDSPFKLTILGSIDSLKPLTLEVRIKGNKINLSNETFNKEVNYFQPFIVPGLGNVQIEKGPTDAKKDEVYEVNVQTVRQTVAGLIKKLEIAIPIKQTDIISLSLTDPVPQYSEDILNGLIKSYIEGNILDKNKVADSTIAFIDKRLIYVSQELGSIEGNVQSFKQRNKIADITAQSGLLVTSTGSNIEEEAKIQTQLSVLSSVENYLNSSGANERIIPSGALLEDPGFASLVERYNLIVLEKEKSSISKTEDNPYIQNLNNQIAGAKSDMLTSLKGFRKSLEITKDKIQARSGELAGQVRKVPAVERTYLDLSRQQQIKQELYVYLLTKKEETAISKTSNISNCSVIEPPLTMGAVSPVKTNIIGYGVFLGILLPIGIIFIGDRLNNKINSKEDVIAHTTVPVIGEIGKSPVALETIVVEQGSRTPISEQFRALRTNLGFFMKETDKTVLLTSSMSGEGKSFISLNLATVLAISGKKVVVMEMDLRKPNLSNKLNLRNDFGFTNYIVSSELTADSIIKSSGTHENLFIISSGNIPPNPTEIILNSRMDDLMSVLTEKFDYIIIDAPPVGLVTDAQLLSKYADLTLYVVRQGFTIKEQLGIAQDLYLTQKMKNIAILMNDVKIEGRYGYGYGYGYGLEEEKQGFFSKIFKK